MTKTVLAGMRASGRLHLGNYLGGAKGMLTLQADNQYETLYMIADMHGITTPYKVDELTGNRHQMILDYLAVGLDPEKSIVFQQSDVGLHGELAFYLSSVVTIARMQHLPTYKEKIKNNPGANSMALLNYPILMAADILLYKAHLVPVGLDQEPHIEVAREIAKKMNQTYGTDFPEPKRFTVEGNEYIPSLTGEGKMSKSIEGSYISLTDDLETIQAKLAKVPTDTGTGKEVPLEGGVASLMKLVELFESGDKRKYYEEQYLENGIRYGDLKSELSQSIFDELNPIQQRRKELEKDPEYLERILTDGAKRARVVAEKTIDEVKNKMGLV